MRETSLVPAYVIMSASAGGRTGLSVGVQPSGTTMEELEREGWTVKTVYPLPGTVTQVATREVGGPPQYAILLHLERDETSSLDAAAQGER